MSASSASSMTSSFSFCGRIARALLIDGTTWACPALAIAATAAPIVSRVLVLTSALLLLRILDRRSEGGVRDHAGAAV